MTASSALSPARLLYPAPPPSPPLKHPRYPCLDRARGNRLVTIAAGFLYRGGALLCTDTELTGGTLKTQAAKIVSFGCKGGMLSFAYAGNYDYALCVIDKCRRKLASVTAAELLPELERIIDKEYRRLVLSNPNQTWDHTLPYSFLISFSAPPDGVKMFVARQTSLRQVLSYECIGVGSDLASYLIGDHSVVGMSERRILSLAAFILANVKANVSGCGGMSHFLGIRDDGAMAEFYSAVVPGFVPATSTEWLEFRAKGFDSMARDLFFSMADQSISDDEFRSRLEVFNARVSELRTEWNKTARFTEPFVQFERATKVGR